jgi:hypothetical protein
VDGTDGVDGIQGPPGAGVIALGFSYAPFDELAAETDITEDSDVPSRLQDIPFGGFTNGADETPPVDSSRSHGQCLTITDPISLYSYMAFGGESPTYRVSVTGSGDDAMPMDDGHGFHLTTDDGIVVLHDNAEGDMFAGDDGPNLAAGNYQWTLHVIDDSQDVDQMDERSWNIRIMPTAYTTPDAPTTTDEEPTVDTDDDIEDWADFLSSGFEPSPFSETSNRMAATAHADEGTVKSVDISDDTDMSVMGQLEEDDVDVIYVGGLTPDAVLNVKVVGTSEGSVTHDFNNVTVKLYRHIPGQGQGDAIAMVDSEVAGFKPADVSEMHEDGGAFKDLDCGFYYLTVSGEAGDYTIDWEASGLTTT